MDLYKKFSKINCFIHESANDRLITLTIVF